MSASAIEKDVQAIGRAIFAKLGAQSPSVFQRDWWSGKLLEYCMKDEAFKLEMFRFVDVFPALRGSDEVARHVREYFQREGQSFGFLGAAMGLAGSSLGARIGGAFLEKNIVGMARRFIAGAGPDEAAPVLAALRKDGLAFTVDLLGEATCGEAESLAYARRYTELMEGLVAHTAPWPSDDQLDRDAFGPIPRVNVSIKVSALYSQMDPMNHGGSIAELKARLLPIFRRAKALGAFVNLDMEHHQFKDLTLGVFCELMEEPELAKWSGAGIAIQAYLRETQADVRALIKWARKRGAPVTIRLVKGAYWDYETVLAGQRGWPVPVWEHKWESDASFETCATLLLESHKYVRFAAGSHNVRTLAHSIATARALGLADSAFEAQMLFGMAEPIKAVLAAQGLRVRDYVPVGELLPGMAYFVRRLLENTSNESFLRQRFSDNLPVEELLLPPEARATRGAAPVSAVTAVSPTASTRAASTGVATVGDEVAGALAPFQNTPPADYADAATRERMRKALLAARKTFGGKTPLFIAGKERKTERTAPSRNPSSPDEVVTHACQAGMSDVSDAVAAARAAFPGWRDTPARERAALLLRVAALLRDKRHELAALMVLEAGKGWREADGDVTEAIDFLEYYAREAVRLGSPRRIGRVPGELNHYHYEPRGVGVIIAPWNFPLAILCGMTSAAVVTGNCAIMKPAPQTPAIAARLMEAFRAAKAPAGVVQLLFGGAEVGEPLACDKDVDFVVFTGSKAVGLQLIERCARVVPGQRNVKKVIAEMGGKNAIIVDSDADLDEAVQGVVASAFGFQGQKCSACSRVIVQGECYDTFVSRLQDATASLRIGPAEDPATRVGPVIDERAQRRILDYIQRGAAESTLLFQREAPAHGYFVGPTLFVDVPPRAVIAQQEIFGPVLAVMRAQSFEQALALAMDSEFALTGGLFSRSPARIEQARREFRVGNLYLNRGITGALVERQPFGGAAMSGVGSKAGGPDYLLQFTEPRVVTENTLRRGFAPAD